MSNLDELAAEHAAQVWQRLTDGLNQALPLSLPDPKSADFANVYRDIQHTFAALSSIEADRERMAEEMKPDQQQQTRLMGLHRKNLDQIATLQAERKQALRDGTEPPDSTPIGVLLNDNETLLELIAEVDAKLAKFPAGDLAKRHEECRAAYQRALDNLSMVLLRDIAWQIEGCFLKAWAKQTTFTHSKVYSPSRPMRILGEGQGIGVAVRQWEHENQQRLERNRV
ncbi:TPA: hypothetical protein ACNEJR_004685 [Escherichia coli]